METDRQGRHFFVCPEEVRGSSRSSSSSTGSRMGRQAFFLLVLVLQV
jgi:hypothetical protein